ncbi:CHAT domain-containing protein [Streptomyces sp. NPDC056831]|uniref:CHAT domain-containing protein n=1 Tax=Streptomyces sp. NPDC056831 TaxID=3345954 RepID=UPI00368AEC45
MLCATRAAAGAVRRQLPVPDRLHAHHSRRGPLRWAPEEVRRIRPFLHCPMQLAEPDPPTDGTLSPPSTDTPTTAAVLARLPRSAVAHFACHGSNDHTNQGMLHLHDHATAPLTISALAQTDLAQPRLAYLSACGTANPGTNLIDQALHLTGAFQLAGFPQVVGALWPIDDRQAAVVTESFYSRLTADGSGRLDPDQAASALPDTVRAARDRCPAPPSLRAGHLHTGA